MRRGERDSGALEVPTTAEQQRVKEFEPEVRELHRANEVLRRVSTSFGQAEFDRRMKS